MRHAAGAPGILYISYDGMLEPLGQSQVVAYLERLATDARIHLVSYEKPADRADPARMAAMHARLDGAGIAWHPLTWHKAPTVPATLFDIAMGAALGIWLAARHRLGLVHARSYVPALIGWLVKLLTGARLLFDMRGLWVDERVDGGIWPAGGRLTRVTKRVERVLLRGADHLVTLTHASVPVVAALAGSRPPPITVIPTCADLDRFTPREGAPPPAPFTLGYLGSVGTWYLFDEVLTCFALVRAQIPDARLLVVNRHDHAVITAAITAARLPADAVEITAADHAQVPALIRRMNAGTALNRPAFSKLASAPTKLAEFLGCGVPCLGNTGVGDMAALLDGEGVGVAISAFTPESSAEAVARLLALCAQPELSARCRRVAEAHFSVTEGAARYRAIYAELAA